MNYKITDENLVIVHGGHTGPGVVAKDGRGRTTGVVYTIGERHLGHQRHYPIFITDDGIEMISLNGQTLTKISDLNHGVTRRERVERK